MDQNATNTNVEEREPLPTFGDNAPQSTFQPTPVELPVFEQETSSPPTFQPTPVEQPVFEQQPTFQQTPPPEEKPIPPEVTKSADSAFGKSLAAAIMALFPITSIVAIFYSSKGLAEVEKTEKLAAQYGVSAGGKNTAAKILGMVGKIGSIVMTAIYALYALIALFYIAVGFIYLILVIGGIFTRIGGAFSEISSTTSQISDFVSDIDYILSFIERISSYF